MFIVASVVWTGFAQAQEFMGIPIKPEHNTPPYQRSLYDHWIDADGDKEDARVEVLIEESLTPANVYEKPNGKRAVQSGLWVGAYTGLVTTDPADLDIDHMIPLKEVHESGGHAWDRARRRAFANDLTHRETLIAVKSGSNRSKSHKDPAEWMPPNRAFWCQYLNDWIAVKQEWGLAMDQAEADAVQTGLSVCERYKNGDRLEGRH